MADSMLYIVRKVTELTIDGATGILIHDQKIG